MSTPAAAPTRARQAVGRYLPEVSSEDRLLEGEVAEHLAPIREVPLHQVERDAGLDAMDVRRGDLRGMSEPFTEADEELVIAGLYRATVLEQVVSPWILQHRLLEGEVAEHLAPIREVPLHQVERDAGLDATSPKPTRSW
jgi:hypothetical protein